MSGSHYANAPEYGAYFSAAPDGTIQYDLPPVVRGELHVNQLEIDTTVDGHTPPAGGPMPRVLGKETPRQLASIQLTPEQLTVGAGALAPDARAITPWLEQAKAELAALRAEVERLADALAYETRARLELERIVKALEGVISHHADALTVIQLREGL